MPALRNERHERFAQGIAAGKNGTDAYLGAGYALARDAAARNAYRLRSREDVKARIDELVGKQHGRAAVEQVVESVRTGRPTLYRPELCEMVRRLALLGLNDVEMADAINIDVHTFSDWKARHREFRQALARGGVQADAKVAQSHYRRATGYRAPAVKIMQYEGQPIVVPYEQYYPPDVGAQKNWLANRRPDQWRERKEVERKGLPNFSEMDAEARFRWATQLVERVQRVLAQQPVIIDQEPEPEEEE
jgi:hypothetical protein